MSAIAGPAEPTPTERAMRRASLDIVEWSAVSPFGYGRSSFADGMRAGHSVARLIDRDAWSSPADTACLVPDFDPRVRLGKKGTRSMNRVTGLAVGAVGDLLAGVDRDGAAPEDTGLVLGTTVGSAQSTIDLTRASLTGDQPFHVDSGLIPYAVMNGAAGQCAIWHGLRGPNATVAGGRVAGLLALSYARRLLLTGRASTVLFGAAEEYSTARAWVTRLADGPQEAVGSLLGEGCAMFAMTTRPGSTQPLASVLATKVMAVGDGRWAERVRACVTAALGAADAGLDDVHIACPSGGSGVAGQGERQALADLVPEGRTVQPVSALLGETHAASAAFQLASVLSRAEHDPSMRDRLAVVTSVDPTGVAAAAVLRLR